MEARGFRRVLQMVVSLSADLCRGDMNLKGARTYIRFEPNNASMLFVLYSFAYPLTTPASIRPH